MRNGEAKTDSPGAFIWLIDDLHASGHSSDLHTEGNHLTKKGHPMPRLFRDVNYIITSSTGEVFKALLQSQNKVMLHFTLTKDGMESPRQLFGARNGDHLMDGNGQAWTITKPTKAKDADSKYSEEDRGILAKLLDKNAGNRASISFKIGEAAWVAILRKSRVGMPRLPKVARPPKTPKVGKRSKKAATASV